MRRASRMHRVSAFGDGGDGGGGGSDDVAGVGVGDGDGRVGASRHSMEQKEYFASRTE